MKILILSLSDIRYDGRLRELVKICKSLGQTYYLIREYDNNYKKKSIKGGLLKVYVSMLLLAIKIIQMEHIDVILLDNRKSFLLGEVLKAFFKNVSFVADCRELYIKNSMMSFKSKFGCDVEKRMLSKSDIVICANEYRADKMVEVFGLTERPLVYENIRKLEYNEECDLTNYEEKYKDIFLGDLPVIISTAGVIVDRTTDKLVKAFKSFDSQAKLVLVGGGSEEDTKLIKKIIQDDSISNVSLIDKVGINELKYLISKSAIGVVIYAQDTINNIYCASGKVYEFIYEGVPVITSGNPPLVELCKTKEIGIASDDYIESIKRVLESYKYYKDKVENMRKKLELYDNNATLITSLNERLGA